MNLPKHTMSVLGRITSGKLAGLIEELVKKHKIPTEFFGTPEMAENL